MVRTSTDTATVSRPSPTPSAAMPPSRSGTLSWQQRPTSRGSASVKSRPLSAVASENSAMRSPRATPDRKIEEQKEDGVSRDQISNSLASKDPAWFRQTADRGIGSAAYRKSKEEPILDTIPLHGSVRLPGFSRDSTDDPEKEISVRPEGILRSSLSRDESVNGSASWSEKFPGTASTPSSKTVASPLPLLGSQRLEPPPLSDNTSSKSVESAFSRSPAMSPSQGRISPERMERPTSPTKGLGGFVQSAMLKRSDSVNKRWSAQAGPRLSRGNSIASNRGGYDGSISALSGISASRETSPIANSRPGSSHSIATITRHESFEKSPDIGNVEISKKDEFIKPPLPDISRTRQHMVNVSISHETMALEKNQPTSPGKTESKKWSPTKASWLENAINKPDSPKPKAAPPNQPSWMVDINKAKSLRGSVDLGKSTSFTEVSTSGLLRSPPMVAVAKSPSLNSVISQSSARATKLQEPDYQSDLDTSIARHSPDKNSLTSAERQDSGLLSGASSKEPRLGTIASSEAHVTTKAVPIAENPASQQSSRSPPTSKSKPKPITPTRNDFRSTLRTRQISADKNKDTEPEFKNVFGKLKRTETKNYVAPDELKNNILRGKAGLATTDGPKKTERKDEFKESIMKKKEEMKVGLSSTITRKSSNENFNKAKDSPMPEAIAKRSDLTQSDSAFGNRSANSEKVPSPAPVELLSKQNSWAEKPKLEPPEKKTSAPARLQKEPAGSGKLADRFNPALAGLLQRGPSPQTGGAGPFRPMSPVSLKDENKTQAIGTSQISSGNAPQLTHATKDRARGPKRRLPTSTKPDIEPNERNSAPDQIPTQLSLQRPITSTKVEIPTSAPEEKAAAAQMPSPMPLTTITNNSDKRTPPKTPFKTITPSKQAQNAEVRLVGNNGTSSQTGPLTPQPRSPSTTKAKLPNNPRAPEVRKTSASISKLPDPRSPSNAVASRTDSASSIQEPDSTSDLPEKPNVPRTRSVASAAARWGTSTSEDSQKSQRARSPIKLPTHHDEEAIAREAGLRDREVREPVGLGIESLSIGATPRSPKSPPLPAKKSASIAHRIISPTALPTPPQDSIDSPRLQPPGASRLLSNYFGPSLITKVKLDVDVQALLTSHTTVHTTGKIKTLRKQIWELTGDGKRHPVPSHQEHILFEESLYLCTHVFGNASGKRTTEVYLWCGDGVSPSAIEDAQLFSKTAAKEAGGKLIVLSQGKETSNFFEALGGIVITRRGSSFRSGSSSSSGATATYMLCGRRHMGQIAFDEVDFAPASLCSGFPYILSATSGRLYLWKGRGSGADELGCARLIGMDLGLTGEIEEVDEGKEPAIFWEAFPKGTAPRGEVEEGRWHLKPSCEKYATRLFGIDTEGRPKSSSGFMWGRRGSAPALDDSVTAQVREVEPFAQKDLNKEGIWVVDAFFEIYM